MSVHGATSALLKQRRLDAMHCESVPATDFVHVCEALEDALDAAEACEGVESSPTIEALAAIIEEIEETWDKALKESREEATKAEDAAEKATEKHDEVVNEWAEKLGDMAKDLVEMKVRAERAERVLEAHRFENAQLLASLEHTRAAVRDIKPMKKRGVKTP